MSAVADTAPHDPSVACDLCLRSLGPHLACDFCLGPHDFCLGPHDICLGPQDFCLGPHDPSFACDFCFGLQIVLLQQPIELTPKGVLLFSLFFSVDSAAGVSEPTWVEALRGQQVLPGCGADQPAV